MKGLLACCPIVRAAKRLAIDRDDPLDCCADGLDPLKKTRFKLLGIQVRKDPSKGVMGGNAMGETEQFGKPGFLRLPEFLDFHPSFRPADHSTNRQNDDVPQSMPFGSFHTGIFYLEKDGFQVS